MFSSPSIEINMGAINKNRNKSDSKCSTAAVEKRSLSECSQARQAAAVPVIGQLGSLSPTLRIIPWENSLVDSAGS